MSRRHDVVDCVVVGAGPAGLAMSAALTDRGVEHVVLEQGRVGETWRTQRWNSFRLNTPGWMNQMLGAQPPDSYATAAELVRRLDQLAAVCPVRDGVRVDKLTHAGEGYIVRTGGGELHARTVVVATGDENVARIPALARRLPDRLPQCHAANYVAPELLPAGAVLVVGSAQSGCQIAADLIGGDRQVVLATSAVGRVPVRYRGRAAGLGRRQQVMAEESGAPLSHAASGCGVFPGFTTRGQLGSSFAGTTPGPSTCPCRLASLGRIAQASIGCFYRSGHAYPPPSVYRSRRKVRVGREAMSRQCATTSGANRDLQSAARRAVQSMAAR